MSKTTNQRQPAGALVFLVLSLLGCQNPSSVATSSATGTSSYSLKFADNTYSSNTLSVTRSSTVYSVTYRFYQNIVYVKYPVNKTYESLNVYVPVSINGTAVDTSSVPILFEIGVGGYMSCSTWGTTTLSTNGQYALSAGYVVVQPGCRGRDNGSAGDYYGKAPAAVVDLKAAVRYLRSNSGSVPGNVDRIISSGGSAGGALSALLGASGNCSLYSAYLTDLGAASAEDQIYAVGAWSPITNLENADMGYEWEFGSASYSGSTVNQTISAALQTAFETYQTNLGLSGLNSYGTLTSSNIKDYLLTTYLEPSAAKYIASYGNSWSGWITYSGGTAAFSFADYVSAIGRGKSVPAFDSFFDVSGYSNTNTTATPEAIEFGDPTSSTNYRHFTEFSLGYATGSSTVSSDLQTIVNMMNPMYFISGSGYGTSTLAGYWYIRDGATATDTSAIVIFDLATALSNKLGVTTSTTASTTASPGPVNAWEDWNTGHNVNTDPEGFLTWIQGIL